MALERELDLVRPKRTDAFLGLLASRGLLDLDLLGQRRAMLGRHLNMIGKFWLGSALLADHLPSKVTGAVLDLGAGWGFLKIELFNLK